MFTGIIQEIGEILEVKTLTDGLSCSCQMTDLLPSVNIGDSMSINGVCSTVKRILDTGIEVDYMSETVSKTTLGDISVHTKVNLEMSLTPSDKIGGHFVSGHVDTVGTISRLDNNDPWGIIEIGFDKKFAPFLIPKGSIAIDGISLTVVDVNDSSFTCHLIPHTLKETILHLKTKGDKVNLEFDMIGKYLYRFHELS